MQHKVLVVDQNRTKIQLVRLVVLVDTKDRREYKTHVVNSFLVMFQFVQCTFFFVHLIHGTG
jgi:hypothetical protein